MSHYNYELMGATIIPNPSLPETFLTKERFLSELATREVHNLTVAQQKFMNGARFASFGLGVMGRVMPDIARLGGQDYVLVDIDGVDPSNLQRQEATYRDLEAFRGVQSGPNSKPRAVADAIYDINPYAKIGVFEKPLDKNQIELIIKQSDIVCWGLDAPKVIYQIHEASKKYGKKVVSGLDLGPWTLLRWYDYSNPDTEILDGTVSKETAEQLDTPLTKLLFLALTVPHIEHKVPYELMFDLKEIAEGRKGYLSQTSLSVGAFAAYLPRIIAKIGAGESLHGLRSEVLLRNDYKLLDLPERIKKEDQRLKMLKDETVQKMLGLSGKMSLSRYSWAVLRGLTTASMQ